MTTIDIRPASATDARKIAEFHNRCWQLAHVELAPLDVRKALDEAHRLKGWEATLAAPALLHHVWVAVQGAQIVGLIKFGPASHPVFGARGEVKHLYVAPECQGRGLGARVMREAFVQMGRDGFNAVGLAVTRGNTGALAFYQALGGVVDGAFVDAGPVWKSDNLVVVWEGLFNSRQVLSFQGAG